MFSIKKLVESGLVESMEIERVSNNGNCRRMPYGHTIRDESVEEHVSMHIETEDTEFVEDLLNYIEQYRCDRNRRYK